MERSLKTSTATTRYLGFAALALLLQACSSLSGGPIYGKVLDERFDRPIPDAFVIARWTCQAYHDTGRVCYHVLVTATDAQGRYRFPEWKKEGDNYCAANPYVYLSAHKPGYAESYISSKMETRHLKPFTGGREERLRKIIGAAVTCGQAGESKKNLLLVYRALYEEARQLAITKEDKQVLHLLLHEIDLIELPYDEVIKRDSERYKALRNE
jgi:hypothetical protein